MKGQASFLKQNIWYIIVFIIGVGAFSAMIFNLFTLEGDIARVATEITGQRLINNIELNEIDGAAASLVSLDNNVDNMSVNTAGRVLSIEAENGEDASGYIATMSDVDFDDQEGVGERVCIIAEGEDIRVESDYGAPSCRPTACVDGSCMDMGSYGLYCQGGVWTRTGYHEYCGNSIPDDSAQIVQFNCPDQAYAVGNSIGCGVQFYHNCDEGDPIDVTISNLDGDASQTPTNDDPIECTGNRTTAEVAASFALEPIDSATTETNQIEVEISGTFGSVTETEQIEAQGIGTQTASGLILENIPGPW